LPGRILEEQGHFEKEYQAAVDESISQANNLVKILFELAAQKLNLEEQKTQRGIRDDEKANLEAQLAAATAKAKTALQGLDAKVDELFDITQRLGEAQDALVGLEVTLRELELRPPDNKKGK
jgi:hypothetical protein